MKRAFFRTLCTVAPLMSLAYGETTASKDAHWPQWRGPLATGAAPNGDPPIEWSESKNIKWKVEIPGLGHASPIVWGDRVYIQTAVETSEEVEPKKPAEEPKPEGQEGRGGRGRGRSAAPTRIHEFIIMALDRQSGKTVWKQTLRKELPHEGGHADSSQASNSPITDGQHIIAHFGSRGLYGLDMSGKVLWEKDLGKMETRNDFGEGSSPALFGDTVVVTWDQEGGSFIIALDKKTGTQKWKVDRDESTSWSTPLILDVGGKPQVIASGANKVRAYDLGTGELRWQCGGMTQNVIPSPVSDGRLVYLASGFRGSALMAVRYAEATGDITGTPAVAWVYEGQGTPYVPSVVLYDDALYFMDTSKAILSCVNASTGKAHYAKQRLEEMEGVYASPVAANGRVYVAGRCGRTAVIKSGADFKVLATNKLEESFSASPAIAGRQLFLRGRKLLYCIERP